MLDAIRAGARVAFAEYPGVKQLRELERGRAQKIKTRFWETLAELADLDAKVRIRQAEKDAQKVADIIFGKLVIVDEDGCLHRQNGYTFTVWKRKIEPIVGAGHDAASICGVHGAMREAKYDDFKKEWCPQCWPKVRELIDKYWE